MRLVYSRTIRPAHPARLSCSPPEHPTPSGASSPGGSEFEAACEGWGVEAPVAPRVHVETRVAQSPRAEQVTGLLLEAAKEQRDEEIRLRVMNAIGAGPERRADRAGAYPASRDRRRHGAVHVQYPLHGARRRAEALQDHRVRVPRGWLGLVAPSLSDRDVASTPNLRRVRGRAASVGLHVVRAVELIDPTPIWTSLSWTQQSCG